MNASLKYNKDGDTYRTELREENTAIGYTTLPNGKGRLSLTDVDNHASLKLMMSTKEAKLLAHALISLITELE